MRIVHLCTDPGVPVFGRKGSSVHVQEVVRAMRRGGHEVVILARRLGGQAPADLADVEVHQLPPLPRRGRDTTADLAAREEDLMASGPDVQAALDTLHAARGVELVYERFSLFTSAATDWAHGHDIPSVVEVNAPLTVEQARHRTLIHRGQADGYAGQALAGATATVAVSAPVAAWVIAASGGRARPIVVPNGVDPDRFAPRTTTATTRDACAPWVIGFVGTLKPWHGLDVLVEALARCHAQVPDGWRLRLIGDGPQAAAVADRATALGVGRLVEFVGAVDPTAIPGLLTDVDVAVAPYPAAAPGEIEPYFSPLKVFEYLAAGLPVVAGRVGQLPVLLRDGRDIVFSRPSDPDDLAARLIALRADPVGTDAMAARGRDRVVRHHTWDAVVTRSLAAVPVPPRRPSQDATAGAS